MTRATPAISAFAERAIAFVADRELKSIDTLREVATTDHHREFPYDMFLGLPAIEEASVMQTGTGSHCIEFGAGRIGRVGGGFFFRPRRPSGSYYESSVALRADKEHFGASRRAPWFGLQR